jgi:hypothetical protein
MTKDDMAIPDTTTDTLVTRADQGVCQATTTTTTREPPVINAFHPDFMKTFYPDFMKDFRTIEANQEERRVKEPRKVIRKPRALERAIKQSTRIRARKSMTMAEVKAELLKTTYFYIYSKAKKI